MKPFQYITLYLRREPTTDEVLRQHAKDLGLSPARVARKLDVVAYTDLQATQPKARWPWHYTKPTRRNDYVTVNCFRYAVCWLPDLVA